MFILLQNCLNRPKIMEHRDEAMQLNALARNFKIKFSVTGFFLGKLDKTAFSARQDDGFICRFLSIFIIITKGHVDVIADSKPSRVDSSGENVAMIHPHSTLNSVIVSKDCDGVMIASNDFFMVSNMSFIKFRPEIPADYFIGSGAALFRIGKEQIESLSWNFLRFVANMRDKDHLYWGEKLRLNAIEIYLEILDVVNRGSKMKNLKDDSRAGDIFRRFYISVSKNATCNRTVGYYAEQLCISPKYLNVVCKTVCKKNASSVIDDAAVMAASNLLRDFSLSIGQVADMMNFKGQAAFTKFFKKMTGLTPTQFRFDY